MLAFLLLLAPAMDLPQPPCGVLPLPNYSDIERPPAVRVWQTADWSPPSCTGWSPSASSTLIATAGRFRHTTGVEGLRRRIGAISALTGLPYWSTTDQRWQHLIVNAYALSGPSLDQRRSDFTLEEVAAGRILHMMQEDNRAGKIIYRLQIANLTPDRLVYRTENASPIKYLGLNIVGAGEMQVVTFLDRDGPEVWRYYSIARSGKGASLLTGGHDSSLINRAAASFRYIAGIPADREPPAAK